MKLLLFIQFLLTVSIVEAKQPYYFRQYQVDNGLSHNTITACVQDREGFMWFGTRNGLSRFDGYSFVVYRNDPDLPASIGHNWITSIALGDENEIWVGTVGGVYRFNTATETFSLLPLTKGARINHLLVDARGSLWLLMSDRLSRYTDATDFLETFVLPDNDQPTSFCLDQNDQLWIGSSRGMVYAYDRQSGYFNQTDVFSESKDVTSRNITCLYAINSETGIQLLVGTQTHGMKILDINRKTVQDCFRYNENGLEIQVHDFLQKTQNEIWAGTTSGLIIYNLRSGEYSFVRHRTSDPFALSSNLIVDLYEDKEGGIWLGTYAGGTNYNSPYQLFNKYYSYPDYEGQAMKGNIVHDICTDKYNQVWIGTEDAGVNKYVSATGKFTNFSPNLQFPVISHINIHGLVADDDYLWVGNRSGEIDKLHLPEGKYIRKYTLTSPAFQQRVSVVNIQKYDDMLLVATTRGVFWYNLVSDSFECVTQFPNTLIQSIFRDHEGVIWAGTGSNGLYFYNPCTGAFGKFERDNIFPNETHAINDIIEDNERRLWFATNDGVIRYNPLYRTVNHYTTKQGLPSNMVFRMLIDQSDNLWITTTNGLACLNPHNDHITVYTQEHGLIMNQFNYHSGCIDEQGRIYFGTVRGMLSFNPKEISPNYDKVQVTITSVMTFDEIEHFIPNPNVANSVVLKHNQSSFSIGFSAMSYLSPENTQYAYMMEGLSDNWINLKGSQIATYTNLAPGKYKFRVKAANISGFWNDIATVLSITVRPPWWLSPFAIVVYFLLGFIFIIACLRVYHQQSERKVVRNRIIFENEKEKELYQAKIMFFTNVSHEIRTPLTLIKSPLDKVMKHELPSSAMNYLSIVNKNVNWMLDLVNQLLDFRKTELDSYQLNFVKTDLAALIHEICDRFRSAIEDKKLRLDIQSHFVNNYALVDPEAFTKIINNLLSNAIKYASTTIQVALSFRDNESIFVIDVKNDGESVPLQIIHKIFEPFFHYEKDGYSGTGLGLPLAKSLAEMHKGTIELIDETPFTNFRLKLPLIQPDSMQIPEEKPFIQIEPVLINKSLPTLLIVEDNTEMKNYICNEISQYYNSVVANNGKEALEKLELHSIQVIVSDIIMPVMDGFTLLKTVKTTLEYSHIPVIVLTAKNTIQSKIKGLEFGADAYIEKPFSIDVLLAQITNLLTNRENIRKVYSQSPMIHLKSMASSKADEQFLEKLNQIIHEHIANVNLDVGMIADKMNMSQPTLYRKIDAISKLTPNNFIRIARLKKAAELIQTKEMKMYEIAEAVGFNSQSYFTRSFIRQFGINPSEFGRSQTGKNESQK